MSWVEQAELALSSEAVAGVEIVPTHRPMLLDSFGRRALAAPFIACFLWAAVVFRERMGLPLDPIALLLRLLAMAMTVRVFVVSFTLWQRLRVIVQRSRYKLALTEEGLLLRTPQADFAVPKADVIDVREPGDWQEHGGARWADVYLITRPNSGRMYLALPPIFDRTPGTLAERLMRWRGVTEAPEAMPAREPTELPSKLFDAVASGEQKPGVSVIRHGHGWIQRAPFATVLLGIAILEGFLRMPPEMRERVGVMAPMVIALCLLIVPLGWTLYTRRNIAARRGIALLLTPAELMLRARSGVLRVRWPELGKLQIQSRTIWSMLRGAHDSRTLVIHRKQDVPIHYAEAFLGAPAEVVVALCDAYRKGLLP